MIAILNLAFGASVCQRRLIKLPAHIAFTYLSYRFFHPESFSYDSIPLGLRRVHYGPQTCLAASFHHHHPYFDQSDRQTLEPIYQQTFHLL